MRIACVDKSASDRISLEKFLDDSFRECRKSVGHLLVAKLVPTSKEELLLNSLPESVVIGASFDIDESLMLCRDIRAISQSIPVFVFLRPELYTVKNLKRFDSYVSEVFSTTDIPSRFVFKLTTFQEKSQESTRGSLISVQGIKGGVGVTSFVGGLAHAYQDFGKSVVVVDFSRKGDFCQFCLSDKWQSSHYTQSIVDGHLPDYETIEKSIIYLQNGIPVLPPPSGSSELRELWLRDSSKFEIGLSYVELLLERYDVVLVDFSHAEGILPFAIECRSDVRLFLSSNDPGSVHLLTSKIDEFNLPVDGVTKFIVNETNANGLNQDDILDFVSWSSSFSEDMLYPHPIPHDKNGSLWMGTGNTIYTESSSTFQQVMKKIASDALNLEYKEQIKKIPFQNVFKNITSKRATKFIPFFERERIPYIEEKDKEAKNIFIKNVISSNVEDDFQKLDTVEVEKTSAEQSFEYEPPKIRVNQ